MYKLKTVLRGVVQLSAYEDDLKSKQILITVIYINIQDYVVLLLGPFD